MLKKTKSKIINDPIYGFVTIPNNLTFKLIEHRYFQRLRRIRQLGLTQLVYPGALHTRFHHVIGAMHLMMQAIETLRSKGQSITEKEAEAAEIAILLHDIGHGPFSHALEHTIVHNMNHETLSQLFIARLNKEFKGQLTLALKIFNGEYHKKFLHQLVSSQLDVDRLDYLVRDSFYTGVSEGIVGSDRIIKMLDVVNNQLVVELKGIYSTEKFILARRLMYWQVYLHKTVLSAEHMLVNILKRAKELALKGEELFCTPALHEFLYNKHDKNSFLSNPKILDTFAELDDHDIMASVKVWVGHKDKTLSTLAKYMADRKLFSITMQNQPFDKKSIDALKLRAQKLLKIKPEEVGYFVFSGEVANNIYNPEKIRINILFKDGKTKDILEASDQLNGSALAKTVKKYFLCFPKELRT
ncbi:MAG: HD domain-containing protein [Bacteroidetes bacterium]|nr:HD domain-containing protein [Bacteroidota bacterium]